MNNFKIFLKYSMRHLYAENLLFHLNSNLIDVLYFYLLNLAILGRRAVLLSSVLLTVPDEDTERVE